MHRVQKQFLFILLLGLLCGFGWRHWVRPYGVEGNRFGAPSLPAKEILAADEAGRLLPLVSARARESVVAVRAEMIRETQPPFGPPVRTRAVSTGSGIVVTRQGHVATIAHIVNMAASVTVVLPGGTELPAQIAGLDTVSDIALLKVNGGLLAPVRLADSDSLQAGEWVLALGSPLGLSGSVTFGIISATGREMPFTSESSVEYLQTDAAVNPGNSGGPLINLDGDVVGLCTFLLSPTGENSGTGFALPSNLVRFVVESILRQGYVAHGYLGLDLQTLSPVTAEALKLPSTQGALVTRVRPGSPAAGAGIQAGDVIVRFDQRPVSSLHGLRARVAYTAPGQPVKVEFRRNGKSVEVSVTLGNRGNSVSGGLNKLLQGGRNEAYRSKRLGVTLTQEKPESEDRTAVYVSDSDWESDPVNPLPGDCVLKINGALVAGFDDVKAAEKEIDRGDAVLLLLSRRGSLFYTSVRAR